MGEGYLLPVDDERFPPYLRLFRQEILNFLESRSNLFGEFCTFLSEKTGDEWYLSTARPGIEEPVEKMRQLSRQPGKYKDMGVPPTRGRGPEAAEEMHKRAQLIEEKIEAEAAAMKERFVSTLVWDITHNDDAIRKLDDILKREFFALYQEIHLAGLDPNAMGVKIFFARFYREDDVNLLDALAASWGNLSFISRLTERYKTFADYPLYDPNDDPRNKIRQFLRCLPRIDVEDEEWFFALIEMCDADKDGMNTAMLTFLLPDYQDVLDNREALKRAQRDKDRNLNRRNEEVVADEDLKEMRPQSDYTAYATPIDYGETNQELHLRDYQEELVQQAVAGKNTLVVAPTGAGKTEVCIFVAKKHIEKMANADKPSRVVMLVPKVPLVDQQEERFRKYFKATHRTTGFHGDITIRGNSRRNVFLGSDIIVMTAEILLNMLRTVRAEERLYLSDISLLIFDEMHHCNKEHVYKKIMDFIIDYPHPECRPQILGLTATPLPVATTNLQSSLEAIYRLMASANCDTLSTVVRNTASLERYVPKPDEEFHRVSPAKAVPDNFASAASLLIAKIRSLIDHDVKELSKPGPSPYLKPNEMVPAYKTPGPFLARVNVFRSALQGLTNNLKHKPLAACDYFIAIGTALAMDELMPARYALQFLRDEMKRIGELHPSDRVRDIRLQFEDNLEYLESGAEVTEDKPILNKLIETLKTKFTAKPDSKCIVFVAERSTARNLCDFLNRQGVLKDTDPGNERGTVPDFGYITSSKMGTGQSATEQKETLEKFRRKAMEKGSLKCVVSTSVLDEGIDVAECNLIIKYNTSSSAVSKIQRAGRARAWNSKSVLLCLHEGIAESEYSAILTGNMMRKCVAQMMHIGEAAVRNEIRNFVLQKKREADKIKQEQAKLLENLQGREFEVVCRLGNHYICNSDSIRFEGSHYVVVDPLIWDRLMIKITHKRKAVDTETMMLGEVMCVGEGRIEDLTDYTTSAPSAQACGCTVGKIMKLAGAFMPHLKADQIMLREKKKISEEEAPLLACKSWKTIAGVNFYVPPLADCDIKCMLNALNNSSSPVQEEMMVKLEACVEKMSGDAAREAKRRRLERERRERIKSRKKDDYTDLAVNLDEERDQKEDRKEYAEAEENRGRFSYKDSDNEDEENEDEWN